MSMYRPKTKIQSPEKGIGSASNLRTTTDNKKITSIDFTYIKPLNQFIDSTIKTSKLPLLDDNRINPLTISVISSSSKSSMIKNDHVENISINKKSYRSDSNSTNNPFERSEELSSSKAFVGSFQNDLNKNTNKPLRSLHISLRWINLSSSLCSLIFPISYSMDTAISNESLNQFLDVMKWRATGDINETEFTVLYGEFLSMTQSSSHPIDNSKKQSINNSINGVKSSKKKQNATLELMIGVHKLRDYLIEKEIAESQLDLYIGMLMNEVNLRLLNSSISFNNVSISTTLDENIQGSKGSYVLEICTSRWLSLCEECFFCLDTPGYGVLRFDEVFFLSACLSIGVQGWSDSVELEGDLSLGTLTAMAVQFMRDCGASTTMTSDSINISQQYLQSTKISESSTSKLLDDVDSSSMTNLKSANSVKTQYGKQGITVTMFKLYLMNKGIGESSLNTLITHIRSCANKVARISRNCAEDLYNSFKSVDDLGNQISTAIGCPRLWQQAVLSYSDIESMKNNKNIPPIVLFLLTDADKYISSLLRAMECSIDGTKFIDADPKLLSKSQPLRSASIANDELHEISYKLWLYFRIWSVGNIHATNNLYGHSLGASASIGGSGDAQRDPIYQFIVAVIVQYKALQNLLCAALYDMTVTNFGFPQSNNKIKEFSKTVLSVASANLIPDYTTVLVELGFESDSSNIEIVAENISNISLGIDCEGNSNNSILQSPNNDDESSEPLRIDDLTISKLDKPIVNKQPKQESIHKGDNKIFKISSSRHAERKKFELNQFKKHSNKNKTDAIPENTTILKDSSYLSPEYLQKQTGDILSVNNSQNKNNFEANNIDMTMIDIVSRNNIADENQVTKVTTELISALQNLGYSITPKGPIDAKNIEISIPLSPNEDFQYESDLKDFHVTRSNSFSASEASSSVAPSSIADLLQQGQTAGKYAQMLREILRKMSKDDSNVKLKSLEQVIKLGNTLVQTEIENNDNNKIRSPQNSGTVNKSKNSKTKSQQESSTEYDNKVNSPNEQFSIRRVSKVPGHIPTYGVNSNKKVFGHKMK